MGLLMAYLGLLEGYLLQWAEGQVRILSHREEVVPALKSKDEHPFLEASQKDFDRWLERLIFDDQVVPTDGAKLLTSDFTVGSSKGSPSLLAISSVDLKGGRKQLRVAGVQPLALRCSSQTRQEGELTRQTRLEIE